MMDEYTSWAQEFERNAARMAEEWTNTSVLAKIAVEMTEE